MGQQEEETAGAVLTGDIGSPFAVKHAFRNPGSEGVFDFVHLYRIGVGSVVADVDTKLGEDEGEGEVVPVGASDFFVESFENVALTEPAGSSLDGQRVPE
jgi:hypothetical protein